MGDPIPRLRQAALSWRSGRPRRAGTASGPRPSCGTSWPTSSAESGGRTNRRRLRRWPKRRPSMSSPPNGWRTASRSLRPKTVKSYRWQLSGHLLPHFAQMHLDQIGPEDVDRYKAAKLREGALGPNQINKSLGLLAMILDAAGDYGHVDRRAIRRGDGGGASSAARRAGRPRAGAAAVPARGRGQAAADPGDDGRSRAAQRRGVCARLAPTSTLASGTMTVGASKTDAGVRQVDLPDALRENSRPQARARCRSSEGPVFPQPQRAAAERQQRRAALEDHDPPRQHAAR